MSNPIYNIDFGLASERLSPPYKRSPRLLRWLVVLLFPIQWLRNLVLGYYADGVIGNSIPFFRTTDTYEYGNMVIGPDDKVYLNIYTGTTPVGIIYDNTDYWITVLNTYIGIRERLVYTSQTIVLTGILNKKFRVPPSSYATPEPIGYPTPPSPFPLIYIHNTDNDIEQIYFYKINEGYLGVFFQNITEPMAEPVYLYYETEYVLDFDYIVMVPSILANYYPPPPIDRTTANLLKLVEAETTKYNLIDKNFKVEYYS
jgi:hypothetical protein